MKMAKDQCKTAQDLGDNVSRVFDVVEGNAKQKASHLKEELKSFCLQTSIKGVPRAMKNENIFLKTVWAFGVCGLLGICFWQVYQALTEYLEYPTITLIEEAILGKQLTEEGLEEYFPATTVCNVKPLASNHKEIARNNNIPTLDDYLNYLESIQQQGRPDVVLALLSEGIYSGYYSFIGTDAAQILGHQQEDYIVDCSFIGLKGATTELIPCNEIGLIKHSTSSQYFNCYTIEYHPEKKHDNLIPLGVNLLLYHDNFMLEIQDLKQFSAYAALQNVGSKIFLHPNNSLHNEIIHASTVTVGQLSEVQMAVVYHDRLGSPYGNCSYEQNIKIYTQDGHEKKFTFYSCTRSCINARVREECGCLTVSPSERPWPETPDIPICDRMNESESLDTFLNRSKCEDRIKETMMPGCLDTCPFLCKEEEFSVNVLSSRWPDKASLLPFYETFIQNRPYSSHFNIFESIKAKSMNASQQEEAIQMLQDNTLIEDNFARVDMILASETIITMRDTAKYTTTDLFSTLGGTLNLYSGITFVISIELFELLYLLCFHNKAKKQTNVIKVAPANKH